MKYGSVCKSQGSRLDIDNTWTFWYTTSDMKPDKLLCQNCQKEIPRGKWCSDKCRKAYARNPDKKPDISKPDTDKSQVGQIVYSGDIPSNITKTDKTFYDRAMKDFGEPYYNFNGRLRKEECRKCGKKFDTRLSLLKFCSYGHYKIAFDLTSP